MKIVEILKGMFSDIYCSNFFKVNYLGDITIQDIEIIRLKIAQYNVQRIVPLCLIIILFEIFNIVMGAIGNLSFRANYFYISGQLFLISIAILFLWLANYLLSKHESSINKLTYCYRAFWLSLCFGMLMFSFIDVEAIGFPANCLLFTGLVAITTISSIKEAFIIFTINSSLNLMIFGNFGFKPHFLEVIFLVNVSGFLLSQMIHKTYVNAGIKAYIHTKKIEDLNKQLAQASEHDYLTNLLNKRGLEEHLNLAWAYCKRNNKKVGMLFFDVDYFKNYNDAYGHFEGDKVLSKIGSCIKDCFKRETDIICRVGGEEFLVFLSDISDDDIQKMAFRVRNNLENLKIKTANNEVSEYLTFSIGIATAEPKDEDKANDLIMAADQALYFAKESGRNCIAFRGSILAS